MDQTGGIIFVSVSALVLLTVLPWAILSSRKARKLRRARLEALRGLMDGGEARVWARGLRGRFRGRNAEVEVRAGNRYGPPELFLRVACSAALRFQIVDSCRAEVMPAPDSMAQHRLQVGDADLDQRFNFVSQNGEIFKRWALAPENREKFMRVLSPSANGDSTGWPERRFLSLKKERLEWSATHYPDADLEPVVLRGILETLDRIARSLESI